MLPLCVCFALFMSAFVSASITTPSCSAISPPSTQLNCCTPVQLMFVMDNSGSMEPADLESAYIFAKKFRCSFPDTTPNLQLGMISFNAGVKVIAPMKKYTHQEWYDQVDTVLVSGGIPQSTHTPLAEAFQLTREIFQDAITNKINPNCTAKAVAVQRIAIVFTDGKPVQNVNTPNVAGFSNFPAAWRVANQDSSEYSEVTVPAQAKLLKALDVRVVFLGLNNTFASNDMQPEYFAGNLIESRKCANVKTQYGFGAAFCANKLPTASPTTLAHQSANSQCYRKQVTSGGGAGSFMDETLATGWACKYRNPTSNDFPIASTPSDVLLFESPTLDLTTELLTRVVPAICPIVNDCFLV